MRRLLERAYEGAGYLAGAFIVLIVVMVLAQIVGRWFGVIIPSTEDFSGYFLAAATFFALASTYRRGGHIRVSLLVRHLSGPWVRLGWLFAITVFLVVSAYGAWYTTWLVIESWQFGELSQGYIPVPIWIPQTAMAAGMILLLVALVDDFILVCRGGTPGFSVHEQGQG